VVQPKNGQALNGLYRNIQGGTRLVKRLVKPVIQSKTAREWEPFVLFEGCTMSRRMIGSRFATQYLLDKYNFDYTLLEKEKCCGAPVRRSGGQDTSNELRDYNLDLVLKEGLSSIVTGCPGCGSQLKSPEADHLGIKVYHFVEILYDLAVNNELYLPQFMLPQKPLKITAHYPCHLHRGMGILCDIAHKRIVEAFPSWEWVELPNADECCGAGGGVRASQKPLSFQIRERKLENITVAGADIVLAACPFCELQIDEGLRELNTPENKARSITPQALIMMQFRDLPKEVQMI
jgi:fumarate reductase (CoM/CoB) subunit B